MAGTKPTSAPGLSDSTPNLPYSLPVVDKGGKTKHEMPLTLVQDSTFQHQVVSSPGKAPRHEVGIPDITSPLREGNIAPSMQGNGISAPSLPGGSAN